MSKVDRLEEQRKVRMEILLLTKMLAIIPFKRKCFKATLLNFFSTNSTEKFVFIIRSKFSGGDKVQNIYLCYYANIGIPL